ncbi:hypothetical protein AMK17_34785 [Streptomyces sp. CB00072]|nr:hypothetical protein AMK17_34785 [Streptomyces sp. CB00072]
MPDRGGQSQHAPGGADSDALDHALAVLFRVDLVLRGVVDRVDQLTQDMPFRCTQRTYRGQCASQWKPRIACITVRHSKYE